MRPKIVLEVNGYFLKKQWFCVVGEVTLKLGIKQLSRDGSNFQREEIINLTFRAVRNFVHFLIAFGKCPKMGILATFQNRLNYPTSGH